MIFENKEKVKLIFKSKEHTPNFVYLIIET